MNRVFVLDVNRLPLMPCYPARARQLLKAGQARVLRRYPFTIIFAERVGGEMQPTQVKLDPGSKTTGIAIVVEGKRGKRVVWAGELSHRSNIKSRLEARRALRRSRRSRKTRYRAGRFNNRRRRTGWLPPSVQSRVENVKTWVHRLRMMCPVSALAMELVKFDTQLMQNAEIRGVEYQQGELAGYEVREYLLEKWRRKCAYCGKTAIPLQVEHITPRSRGGSDRVSNLTLACENCNLDKGTQTAAEFGYAHLQAQAKVPLKDATAVNTTRWVLFGVLKASGLPVEVGTGGRTKFNRTQQNYPKAHWIDAACVGESGQRVKLSADQAPLAIVATGHGNRQMCGTDAYGFPIRHRAHQKMAHGFQTGDLVRAIVPQGKHAGKHVGRISIRTRPSFKLKNFDVHPKYLRRIHYADGYEY
ncbi:MAG TPA: RNA-guided endonuclease IscB [Aggregatilineales bacterium]|nr:RNA-guided endonuclease IscB [Aggregatilineales bacterium]